MPAPGQPFGQYGQTGYSAAPAGTYANWGQRVGAYLIDIAPVIAGYIVVIILNVIINSAAFGLILSGLLWLGALGWTIYNRWITMGNTGQSLGKRVLNIKLVKEDTGQPIGAGMAFARDICHIVDSAICMVGYLFPLWDSKAQTLADKILTTVVVPA